MKVLTHPYKFSHNAGFICTTAFQFQYSSISCATIESRVARPLPFYGGGVVPRRRRGVVWPHRVALVLYQIYVTTPFLSVFVIVTSSQQIRQCRASQLARSVKSEFRMSLLNNNSADTGECPILSSPAIVSVRYYSQSFLHLTRWDNLMQSLELEWFRHFQGIIDKIEML